MAPADFHPAGTVVHAQISPTTPPFIRTRKYKGARAEGIRYERKVQKHMAFNFPDTYLEHPWLYFRSAGTEQSRWCQPDGIIIDTPRGIVTCCEIKYAHTASAWWQTRKLYIPVLEKIFIPSLWAVQVCEIVKWYDAAVSFPEYVEMASEPDRPSAKFKVHICRP